MKIWCLFLVISILPVRILAQKKFTVKTVLANNHYEYYFVDEKGKTIRKLDSTKYYMYLSNKHSGYFAIFHVKGEKEWCAIDINLKILFKVYNTSFGEPSPDELIENKIRIVDENQKIGFANYLGKIIIKPQFEAVSAYQNNKAIIGASCKKIPWNSHIEDSDPHYFLKCDKNGYIDANGKIILYNNFTVEQVMKKIKWKGPLY